MMQYQSLERALQILLKFETQNKEVGAIELSNLLGIHRSTVTRIMKVLAAYEFLERNSHTKKFSLGQANIRLASSLKQSLRSNLVQIAKPYVDDLRDRFQETTIIETLVGHNWVMAYAVESPGRVRLVAEIGERIPCHEGRKIPLGKSHSGPHRQKYTEDSLGERSDGWPKPLL